MVGAQARTAVITPTLADLVARARDGDSVAIPAGLPPATAVVEITKNLHLFSAEGAELADRIVVRAGASLQLSGLRRTATTVATEGAQINARDCDFESPQGGRAVLVDDEGRFTAVACRFTGREANAVLVRGGASARLSGCHFRSFECAAVGVEDAGATVELSGCNFTDMTSHAVSAERGAHARIVDSAFENIGGAAWTAVVAATSDAGVDMTNCRWSSLRADGLLGRGGAQLSAVDCKFDGVESDWAAVTVDDSGTRVELSGCRFTRIAGEAVIVDKGADAHLNDCTLQVEGPHPAVAADGPGSTVAVMRCRIVTTASAAASACRAGKLIIADSLVDTPSGSGLMHTNIDLSPDGSHIRVSGQCGFRGSAALVSASVRAADVTAGATVSVVGALPTPCRQCNGTGAPPGTALRTCDRCVTDPGGSQLCAQCRGTRLVGDAHCPGCDGRGERSVSRPIEIEIPAGAAPGDTLVAPGRGGPGLGSAPAGDLRVVLEPAETGRYRSVEEFVEKRLGVRIATDTTGPVSRPPLDSAARRALDEAVRREAIRLGYLTGDSTEGVQGPLH